MNEYIKWLENKIEFCLEDKDLQREHWAFCQALKKYRELEVEKKVCEICNGKLSTVHWIGAGLQIRPCICTQEIEKQ